MKVIKLFTYDIDYVVNIILVKGNNTFLDGSDETIFITNSCYCLFFKYVSFICTYGGAREEVK